MDMQQRTNKTLPEYAGHPLRPGERFEVEPPHVPLLLAMGLIEPEEGEPGYQPHDAAPHKLSLPKKRKAG